MITQRILFTGHGTPQLQRHIAYALELGATVLHVGYDTIYPIAPPATYSFTSIGEETTPAIRARDERGEAYQEVVTRGAQRLAALAEEFRPDLCHVVGMDLLFDLCVVAKLHPLIVSVLGYVNDWVYGKAQIQEQDQALTEVDAVLIHPPMLVEIARTLLPASVRVESFTVGLDSRHFRPVDEATRAKWRRALKVPAESLAILSPRGWARGYNHEYVVRAFAQALPRLPSPATLLFIAMGRSGDRGKSLAYLEEVRELTEALGVAEHVRWLPTFPYQSMSTLYNAADLVISYATPDTFGTTVLEVMACARPILVPDLPTYPGSVIAEHCRMAPRKDADGLAEAILDMLVGNPPSVEALEAGRQAILMHYDKPVVLRQLESIYDALILSR